MEQDNSRCTNNATAAAAPAAPTAPATAAAITLPADLLVLIFTFTTDELRDLLRLHCVHRRWSSLLRSRSAAACWAPVSLTGSLLARSLPREVQPRFVLGSTRNGTRSHTDESELDLAGALMLRLQRNGAQWCGRLRLSSQESEERGLTLKNMISAAMRSLPLLRSLCLVSTDEQIVAHLAAVQHHCPLLADLRLDSDSARNAFDLQLLCSTHTIPTHTPAQDVDSASAACTSSLQAPIFVGSLASRLQSLNLQILHAADMTALGSGAFTQLRQLELQTSEASVVSIATWSDAALPELTTLFLLTYDYSHTAPLPPHSAAVIARAAPQLQNVDILDFLVDDSTCRAFLTGSAEDDSSSSSSSSSSNSSGGSKLQTCAVPHLTHLLLSSTERWTSASAVLIASMCPQLRVLRLESDVSIDDDAMRALLLQLPQLEELHLDSVEDGHLTVAGLQPMLRMPIPVRAPDFVTAVCAAPVPLQHLRSFSLSVSCVGNNASSVLFLESFAAALRGGALPALQYWCVERCFRTIDEETRDRLMLACTAQRQVRVEF